MVNHVTPWGHRLRRMALRTVLGAVLITAVVIGGTAARVWLVARSDDNTGADAVVVLGAAQYGGRPSAVLRARLRHAKSLYDQGVAKYVVTVGGRRVGDTYTEAEAGEHYLTANGVPKDRIVVIAEGSDTLGSIRGVANEAKQRGWASVVIVSDPWHSLRARTMARDAGLDARASATRSGPIVRTRDTQFRYILRETGALLYYQLTHAPADDSGTGLG